MNASVTTYGEAEFDYKAEFHYAETTERPARTNQLNYGRRRDKQPRSYNGMHRRRQRRIKW